MTVKMASVREGVLIVNKPRGITSHAAVQIAKKKLGLKKAGHLGTLDPMAEGVLAILLGDATKMARFFVLDGKRYDGAMCLGAETDTWDADGKIIAECDDIKVSEGDLKNAFMKLTGTVDLLVPPYSAVKKDGVPFYKKARRGLTFETPLRSSEIFALDLVSFAYPKAEFKCSVSSGTYVRSIVHRVGELLGCGAYLEKLVRTKSGMFGIENAVGLDELDRDVAEKKAISLRDALSDMPEIIFDDEEATKIKNGAIFDGDFIRDKVSIDGDAKLHKAIDGEGNLFAIMEIRISENGNPEMKPLRVLNREEN